MSSHLPGGAQRSPVRAPLHKVVTRHNGLLFHGIAVASLIECAAPLHVDAIAGIFAADPDVRCWLEQEWQPIRARHGGQLRAYAESLWREFDWSSAFDGFYRAYRPRVMPGYAGRSRSEVALALCATAAQAAAFYRGLASCAEDPELRELLCQMGADEGGCFDYFRALFERCERAHPLRVLHAYRTIVGTATRARDGVVRLAFCQLPVQWYENPPFPELQYRDFIRRVGESLCRRRNPGAAERLLFRPWLKIPASYGSDRDERRPSEAQSAWPRARIAAAA